MSDINITHDDFFKMRDTIKHHVGFMAKQALEIQKQADEIAKKDAEIEDLKFEIQNEQDWQGAIIKEECTKDEIHCPCVPALRKEITKLREALKFYADGDHFDYDILKQEIITDYGTKAQEALDDK